MKNRHSPIKLIMKLFTKTLLLSLISVCSYAQIIFDEEIDVTDFESQELLLPPSPLTAQVIFVGGHDVVQTTATYGNPAGQAIAKEWHDFIGFTADESGESIGWVTVNHEQIYQDDRIGDGGGMTAFRVDRNMAGEIEVVEQTLSDGRTGHFFNVDFVNTVGETGMNCGGIVGPNGRIWTAEEWYRGNTNSIWNGRFQGANRPNSWNPHNPAPMAAGYGVRDTAWYKIDAPEFPLVDGDSIPKYMNFNYMTEIDPKEAVAIRKQYNWGKAGWEGGAISNDGKYVYLGIDATPAPWVRFEADTPFDFTQGTLTVYKEDNPVGQRWIEVPESKENIYGGLVDYSLAVGATMYVRNEWVTIDKETGVIYWTETGRDSGSSGPGLIFSFLRDSLGLQAQPGSHHNVIAQERGLADAFDPAYQDYYGRVLYYDPATEEVGVVINGGPYFEASPAMADYPSKHLSNPDGLSVMTIDGKQFLMIQEDLNGSSFGRMPEGISNRLCELYLLPVEARNADVDELVRITAIPAGAEITGGIQIDENTIL
jgi:secreted PhoX family phosphatase